MGICKVWGVRLPQDQCCRELRARKRVLATQGLSSCSTCRGRTEDALPGFRALSGHWLPSPTGKHLWLQKWGREGLGNVI